MDAESDSPALGDPSVSSPRADVRRARAAMYAVYAAEGLAFASLISRTPQVQRAHGLSDTGINLLIALVPVVSIAGGLLTARLTGRFGSATVLRAAQLVFYIALPAIGLAGGLGPLVTALVVFGVAVGVLEASMNAHAVAVQRHLGRSLVNGFFAAWSAAAIAGSLWVSFANDHAVPLAGGFALPAVAGLVIALVTAPLLLPRGREKAPEVTEERLRAAAAMVPWRPVLAIGGLLACAYVAEGAVTGFAVKYLGAELNAADTMAPLAITAFTLATLTGRVLADAGVRRWGATPMVRGGAVLATAGLAAVLVATEPVLAIVGFGLAGLGLCSMAPSAYVAAGGHDPTGLGVAVARVGIFNYLGYMAGTAVVAAVQPLTSYRAAYVIPAVLMVLVAVLATRFEPRTVTEATGTAAATATA